MRMTLRTAVVLVVFGLSLQVSVANAGLRHFRVFCPGCQPAYSAPVYVAMPAPTCACAAPMISYAPTCCQSSQIDMGYAPETLNSYGGPSISAYAPTSAGIPITAYGNAGTYGAGSFGGAGYGFGNGFSGAGYGMPYLPGYGGIPYGVYTPVPIDFQDDLVW